MSTPGAIDAAARSALELGHVETLRAHYARMEVWFDEARALADGDPGVLAWADLFRGMGRTAVGRLHVLRGDTEAARPVLDRACADAAAIGWMSFLPFPRALRAQVDRMARDLVAAA